MGIKQILQDEIHEAERWTDTAEGVYKRDLVKRVELMNWILECMSNRDTPICETIESRINQTIDKINKTSSIFEADPLDSELRILDYLLYLVCRNEIKNVELVQMDVHALVADYEKNAPQNIEAKILFLRKECQEQTAGKMQYHHIKKQMQKPIMEKSIGQ